MMDIYAAIVPLILIITATVLPMSLRILMRFLGMQVLTLLLIAYISNGSECNSRSGSDGIVRQVIPVLMNLYLGIACFFYR